VIRRRLRAVWLVVISWGLAFLVALDAGAATAADSAGEAIYLRGVLDSGAPVQATRPATATRVKGEQAACVNCHQRSGMGTTEGNALYLTVPPVTGAYLFHARGATSSEPVLPYLEWMHGNRDPYTDATLARAIREGVDSNGRALGHLMPRYALGDADMASLISYLRRLGSRPSPGVTDQVLHFATIITPGTDARRREAMIEVMEKYFEEKNKFPIGNSAQLRTSGKTEYAKSMFMSHRLWKLHVWDLSGPASTWKDQLAEKLAREPVLAVVSGLGNANWAPVQEFCDDQGLPCLFPNVDAPIDDERFYYSLFFSRGLPLEAALIAGAIADHLPGGEAPKSVVQFFRDGDSGAAAAAALSRELEGHGIAVSSVVLPAGQGGGVAEALRAADRSVPWVLWLRSPDLAALGNADAAPATVYVSGLMGGLENAALRDDWKPRVRMAYPFELPERRAVRLRYPENWFAIRKIAIIDEPMQVDTYLACGMLAETLSHMADNFSQALLVEMLQTAIEKRLFNTGYYPHLTLGRNQHFASKGGYMVRFADARGPRLIADGGWVVP